jgi:hypothetical protein
MGLKSGWNKSQNDFHAFWEKRRVARPLVSVRLKRFNHRHPSLQKESLVEPRDLPPQYFRDQIEGEYEINSRMQDAVPFIVNPLNIPWMEAFCGKAVYYSGDGFWPGKRVAASLQAVNKELENRIADISNNAWVNLYLDYIRQLAVLAEGRFLIGQSVLRGSTDILLALRGSTDGILDYIDNPAEVRRFMSLYTDFFILILKEQFRWQDWEKAGSSIGEMDQVWSPGRCIRIQEDAFSLLNPELFREFVLPGIRKICGSFDYIMFHTHSGFLDLLPDLMKVEELTAIQITVDTMGPSLEELVPKLSSVQAGGKCLILRGEFDQAQLDFIGREISPCGLYLTVTALSGQEACRLKEAVGSLDWTSPAERENKQR